MNYSINNLLDLVETRFDRALLEKQMQAGYDITWAFNVYSDSDFEILSALLRKHPNINISDCISIVLDSSNNFDSKSLTLLVNYAAQGVSIEDFLGKEFNYEQLSVLLDYRSKGHDITDAFHVSYDADMMKNILKENRVNRTKDILFGRVSR